MYIKLTKLDNSPIWLNAAFIVTIEPRKQGGAVVVPIGDGLDYDVRESPETVLAMLAGAPAPTVVPVPAPASLAPKAEDVSAEPLVMRAEDAVDLSSAPAPAAPDVFADAVADEPKPAKRKTTRKTTTRKAKTKKDEPVEAPDESSAEAPAAVELAAVSTEPVAVSDEMVERVRKMAPRTVKRLANTLKAQFKVGDPEAVIQALVEKGVLALEQTRVMWK